MLRWCLPFRLKGEKYFFLTFFKNKDMNRFSQIWTALIFCFSISYSTAQDITIQRIYSTDYGFGGCTLGYLAIDGDIICYTLELPWRDNKTDTSSIPAGKYEAYVRTDGKKGWRLEMVHVPSRYNIQIHVGNYTSDIIGCTLVGMFASMDYCEVYNSRTALNILRKKLDPLLGRKITITYYNSY